MRVPSESMVPESSVSNSLNASLISSSWSLVRDGVDIGLRCARHHAHAATVTALFGNWGSVSHSHSLITDLHWACVAMYT